MLRSVQICKKCTIFGNLKTTTQEGKKETRQMTPFSPSTFWALTICDIHFCTWKMSKFVFMGSPLWSILVCKIPEFWGWKLWNQNLVPFDSGNIHIKESKEPGFTFSIELRTKFVWSHGLYVTKKLYETFSSKCFNLFRSLCFYETFAKLHNKNRSNFQRRIQDLCNYLRWRALQQRFTELFWKNS